jgi:hypothetical protein
LSAVARARQYVAFSTAAALSSIAALRSTPAIGTPSPDSGYKSIFTNQPRAVIVAADNNTYQSL